MVGDGCHKTALIGKVISEGIFGENPGIQPITTHHIQLCYEMKYVYEKDLANTVAEANAFFGGTGVWSKKPNKPTFNRWETVGLCCDHLLSLIHSTGSNGKTFSDFVAHMQTSTVDTSKDRKRIWGNIHDAIHDQRIVAGLTFEAEYHDVVERWSFTFYRCGSNSGFGPGFRSMDIAEFTEYKLKAWWEDCCKDDYVGWGKLLPKTLAAILLLEPAKEILLKQAVKKGLRKGKGWQRGREDGKGRGGGMEGKWEWHATKTLSRVNKCMRHHVMERGGEGGVEKRRGRGRGYCLDYAILCKENPHNFVARQIDIGRTFASGKSSSNTNRACQ